MRNVKPLNLSSKKKRKKAKSRLPLIIGGTALGLVLTILLGVGVYYLFLTSKMQPKEAIFTGIPEMNLEDVAELFDEEVRTDVSDDVEIAASHQAQFEALLKGTAFTESTATEDRVTSATGAPAGTAAAAKATSAPTTPTLSQLPGIRRDGSVKNYLVIGVDSRSNDFSGRSDAMMIVSINYAQGRINTVSLFRGAYVQIPGRGWSMLNHAYAWGGVSLLIQTIENNFRVGIDDYIVFNFNAFANAINAIGGVDINLTAAEAGALGLSPGVNHLNSSQALAYSRLRSIDWDFNRMGRQRTVIGAVIGKLTGAGMGTINAAVGSVLSSTATSLSQGQVASMTANLPSLMYYGRSEQQLPLPYTRSMFYQGGMEMWSFDFATNISALHTFLYGY